MKSSHQIKAFLYFHKILSIKKLIPQIHSTIDDGFQLGLKTRLSETFHFKDLMNFEKLSERCDQK